MSRRTSTPDTRTGTTDAPSSKGARSPGAQPRSAEPTALVDSRIESPSPALATDEKKSPAQQEPPKGKDRAERSALSPTSMPGLDAVGHGVYLRPYQPYELKRVLFKREHYQPVSFRDAQQDYHIPRGYDVDDSPPMPAKQFLNQVLIEETYDRFSKQMNLDSSVSAGVGSFSISAAASQMSQMRTSEDAYYAVRSSFIPLWSVYLSDLSTLIEEVNAFDIPAPFDRRQRSAYDRFFEAFGSHYVKRVWIGGKAQLFLTILKSSGMTKEEIQAGLKASCGVVAKGDVNARMEASRERLQSSSQCSVAGKGGDELKLAALSSLDEVQYNEWLNTIRQNPQSVELEVAGLWTLIKDTAKAAALSEAYQELTAFTPISAAFAIDKDRDVFFIRGRRYFCYHIERQDSDAPKLVISKWPALAGIGFDRVDAVFAGGDLISAEGTPLNRKIYFFDKDLVARIDGETGALDPGFPQQISAAFPGVDFEAIDAVLPLGRDAIYFFSGNRYTRFSLKANCADAGYPDLIQKRWRGVTFDRIDAALYWGNGKVYFFREEQHIRYDLVIRSADPGYPKHILGNYVEDWRFFD